MNEFVTVSASSYDPASLATKLTEKAADGWTVVAIVPTGGDVTAFLSREATGDSSSAPAVEAAPVESSPVVETAAVETSSTPVLQSMTPEPAASEPAGWAVAPDPAPVATPAAEPAPRSSAPATVIAGIGDYNSSQSTAAAAQPAAAAYNPAPAAAATPSVPAGWYADPAGRFDLRYWDGTTWTEHVSRAGQQYTDAPVA